jgi:hypothetical protein
VTNLRLTSRGNAIVEFDKNQNGEKIMEIVQKQMGDNYEIRYPKKTNPQIKILREFRRE